jgi:hypothetical protein
MYRKIEIVDGGQILLTIPDELEGRAVEIYVLPIDGFSENQNKDEFKRDANDDKLRAG